MATCSHMVRPATSARVRARALGARDVGGGEGWGGGGGEEGQSLTLYQVMMRVFYVYVRTLHLKQHRTCMSMVCQWFLHRL